MIFKESHHPSRKELRRFGVTLLVGFATFGALLFWRGKIHGAEAAWGLGCTAGLCTLFSESSARFFYKIWMRWGRLVGTGVTQVILAFLFVLVITPVAILFRLLGRDALRLKKGAEGDSYWKTLPPITDRSYYKRLF